MYRIRIVLANGEERTLHIKSDFILNDENNPIQVKGIVQDITERKRVEEKLRESEEKYRNIVETANELILITDNENVITYVNQRIADMVGYLRKKLLADQFGVSSVKNIDLLSKGIWKIGGRE